MRGAEKCLPKLAERGIIGVVEGKMKTTTETQRTRSFGREETRNPLFLPILRASVSLWFS